jgi:hypothetical protein
LSDTSSHISVNLSHVQLLHVRAHLDAVVYIPFLVVDLVTVKGQFLELSAIFEAGEALKFIDVIIG